jgi:hypothetical protein
MRYFLYFEIYRNLQVYMISYQLYKQCSHAIVYYQHFMKMNMVKPKCNIIQKINLIFPI